MELKTIFISYNVAVLMLMFVWVINTIVWVFFSLVLYPSSRILENTKSGTENNKLSRETGWERWEERDLTYKYTAGYPRHCQIQFQGLTGIQGLTKFWVPVVQFILFVCLFFSKTNTVYLFYSRIVYGRGDVLYDKTQFNNLIQIWI